jgi:UDP-N-acetylmuramoyl-tripeptide--D-alanyl-D-alanine ligase
MNLCVEEIVEAIGGRLPPRRSSISGVSTDTRSLRRGEVFFALRGETYDGHDFVTEAVKKGASYLVTDRPTSYPDRTIQVPDTLYGLGDLAKYYRRTSRAKVIAVTGSNGKTTTKEMAYAILSARNNTHKSPASFNNLIGVPLTVFGLTPTHRYAVMELGMNRTGEIARECEIAQPDLGIVTNVAPAHLGFFRSLTRIAEAKGELLAYMRSGKTVFLNIDDLRVSRLRNITDAHVTTFSVKKPSDYQAKEVELLDDEVRFRLRNTDFSIPVGGIENVYNALAALAVTHSVGVEMDESRGLLRRFVLPRLRGRVKVRGGVTIINDSYNSNPSSLKAALTRLHHKNALRKIAVLGDMLELGSRARRYHLQLGRFAMSRCDLLVAVGELARYFVEGANNSNALHFSDRSGAMEFLKKTVRPGDAVLIKGSRLMRMEEITDAILASIPS